MPGFATFQWQSRPPDFEYARQLFGWRMEECIEKGAGRSRRPQGLLVLEVRESPTAVSLARQIPEWNANLIVAIQTFTELA